MFLVLELISETRSVEAVTKTFIKPTAKELVTGEIQGYNKQNNSWNTYVKEQFIFYLKRWPNM